MHTPEAAFDKTIQYILICSAGTVFIVAYNLISGMFRGIGNSKLPLCFVAIACVVNIGGDLLLVGVFNLDAAGAAIATVFAQTVSVVLSLVIIKKTRLPFAFSVKSIRFHQWETAKILKFGVPLALQDALTNLSFLIITAIVNSLGLIASAAIGINEKIALFIMLIPIAYMSSVSTFTAQNIGAHKPERAKKGVYYAISSSLVFGVICFVFSFWHGGILAGIFSKDIKVITACAEYMKAYSVDCILVCCLFCFIGYFNGCGNTVFVLVQGILAAFLVRIPFSYFVSKLPEVTMWKIGLAPPTATVFSIILCIIFFKLKKQAVSNPAGV
jgi:putative MATE family efflux protein